MMLRRFNFHFQTETEIDSWTIYFKHTSMMLIFELSVFCKRIKH